MPDCSYCEASVDDEQAYLRHLDEEHGDELGAIDQRRVEEGVGGDSGSGLPTGPLVLGFVLVVAAVLVAYVVFFLGGESTSPTSDSEVDFDGEASLDTVAQSPGPANTAHEHGTIEVVIDGQRVDFSRQQYQLQADEFHFENGDGEVWHKHATDVTLEWAMATLGIGVSEGTVVFDGQVYRDSDPGTDVTVEVNGDPVDPQTYVLQGGSDTSPQQGDSIRIVVETDENS
jgi:hypothetical protein